MAAGSELAIEDVDFQRQAEGQRDADVVRRRFQQFRPSSGQIRER